MLILLFVLISVVFGKYVLLYDCTNLGDYSIYLEQNPGGGSNCTFNISDVGIVHHPDRIEVISNVNLRKVNVNAIAGNKFVESFPGGEKVVLGKYRYGNEFRLKVLPSNNVSQVENGQVTSSLIQIWDGRKEFVDSNFHSLEFAYIWILNSWDASFGKFFLYSGDNLDLIDTGIYLNPDLEWHYFEMEVDFGEFKYINIRIDGQEADVSHVPMAKVKHLDWRNDTRVALSITCESLATWPGFTCPNIFQWKVEYRNSKFWMILDEYSSGYVSYLSFVLLFLCFF